MPENNSTILVNRFQYIHIQDTNTGIITLPVIFAPADTAENATLTLTVYYCEAENEAFCLIDEATFTLPLMIVDDAETAPIAIERRITPPDLDS